MTDFPRICRRCGKPKDDDHVRSPYFCRWEPDREKVVAALMRAELHAVAPKEKE